MSILETNIENELETWKTGFSQKLIRTLLWNGWGNQGMKRVRGKTIVRQRKESYSYLKKLFKGVADRHTPEAQKEQMEQLAWERTLLEDEKSSGVWERVARSLSRKRGPRPLPPGLAHSLIESLKAVKGNRKGTDSLRRYLEDGGDIYRTLRNEFSLPSKVSFDLIGLEAVNPVKPTDWANKLKTKLQKQTEDESDPNTFDELTGFGEWPYARELYESFSIEDSINSRAL